MLSGEQRDHRAGVVVLGIEAQRLGDSAHEARVGMTQHEAQLGRRLELGVGKPRIIERPVDELFYEIGRERRERRSFRARQHHDHALAVREAVVEEIAGERVVFGARR